MQLLYIAALGTMMFLAATTTAVQNATTAPVAVAQARANLDQYRMFMFVAGLYMASYSSGAATITWDTLKTAPGAPRGAAMPATWKVVVAADNSWVACTELDPRTIGAIGQFIPNSTVGLISTQVAGKGYVVVGGPSDVGKAAQC